MLVRFFGVLSVIKEGRSCTKGQEGLRNGGDGERVELGGQEHRTRRGGSRERRRRRLPLPQAPSPNNLSLQTPHVTSPLLVILLFACLFAYPSLGTRHQLQIAFRIHLFHTITYSYTSTLCESLPILMSQNISRGVPGINKQSHPVSAYINPSSTTSFRGHPGEEIPNVDATTSRLLPGPKRILTSTSYWQKQQPRIPSNPETTPLACSYRQPP